LIACYATYFVAHVWRHLNHAMMIGSGQIGRLARIQFAESALVVIAAIAGLHYGGMGTMLLCMATVIFAVTGCILPRLVGHGLLELRRALPGVRPFVDILVIGLLAAGRPRKGRDQEHAREHGVSLSW